MKYTKTVMKLGRIVSDEEIEKLNQIGGTYFIKGGISGIEFDKGIRCSLVIFSSENISAESLIKTGVSINEILNKKQ